MPIPTRRSTNRLATSSPAPSNSNNTPQPDSNDLDVSSIDDPKVRRALERTRKQLLIDAEPTLRGEKNNAETKDEGEQKVYYWRGAAYLVTEETLPEWVEQDVRTKRKRERESVVKVQDGVGEKGGKRRRVDEGSKGAGSGDESEDESEEEEQEEQEPPPKRTRRCLPNSKSVQASERSERLKRRRTEGDEHVVASSKRRRRSINGRVKLPTKIKPRKTQTDILVDKIATERRKAANSGLQTRPIRPPPSPSPSSPHFPKVDPGGVLARRVKVCFVRMAKVNEDVLWKMRERRVVEERYKDVMGRFWAQPEGRWRYNSRAEKEREEGGVNVQGGAEDGGSDIEAGAEEVVEEAMDAKKDTEQRETSPDVVMSDEEMVDEQHEEEAGDSSFATATETIEPVIQPTPSPTYSRQVDVDMVDTSRHDSAASISPTITAVEKDHDDPTPPLTKNPSLSLANDTTTRSVSLPSIPPNSYLPLPQTNKAGNTLRWSLSVPFPPKSGDEDRAESELLPTIKFGRLEGESHSARRRRIRREKKMLMEWDLVETESEVQVEAKAQEE